MRARDYDPHGNEREENVEASRRELQPSTDLRMCQKDLESWMNL
jgi:hypothetical protein